MSFAVNFHNEKSNIIISGTSDAEFIGGKGNDNIGSNDGNVSINASGGHNCITFDSKASDSIIQTDSECDTLRNDFQRALIISGGENNFVVNKGKSATVKSGDDDDTILSVGVSVTLNSGKGNDILFQREELKWRIISVILM